MLKNVFKCVLVASETLGGFPPTVASICSWLESKGIDYAAPLTIDDPFVINITPETFKRFNQIDQSNLIGQSNLTKEL